MADSGVGNLFPPTRAASLQRRGLTVASLLLDLLVQIYSLFSFRSFILLILLLLFHCQYTERRYYASILDNKLHTSTNWFNPHLFLPSLFIFIFLNFPSFFILIRLSYYPSFLQAHHCSCICYSTCFFPITNVQLVYYRSVSATYNRRITIIHMRSNLLVFFLLLQLSRLASSCFIHRMI